ncbi:Unknown protein sequence [Pseudomonas amygdali pv. mellea]|nr:Unknown protein sequence [Pseudomonas amygdali pv. mellea]
MRRADALVKRDRCIAAGNIPSVPLAPLLVRLKQSFQYL